MCVARAGVLTALWMEEQPEVVVLHAVLVPEEQLQALQSTLRLKLGAVSALVLEKRRGRSGRLRAVRQNSTVRAFRGG
jgi:hypothetical protein